MDSTHSEEDVTSASRAVGTTARDWVDDAVREMQAGRDVERHFDDLYRCYERECLGFFRRRGFTEQAEDLTQDVMVRVYKGVESFRFDASFNTWIQHIMENVYKNAVRASQTHKARLAVASLDAEEGDPGSPIEPQDEKPDPLETSMAKEREAELKAGLSELPDRMRECLELRGQGFHYREIASMLALAEGTVKRHIAEGRRRLRSRFGPLFQSLGVFLLLWALLPGGSP